MEDANSQLFALALPPRLLLPNKLVTIARGGFQLRFAENGYVPAGVGNHSCSLQDAGCDANCRSPGSQHLRQKILRKGKRSATDPFVAHEQPSSQSRLDVMEAIASGQLSGLNTQDHRITSQMAVRVPGTPVTDFSELSRRRDKQYRRLA